VGERYIRDRSRCKKLEIWKPNRRVKTVKEGRLLRIQAEQAFSLHWSTDDWVTAKDTQSTPTSLGVEYVDLDGFATGDLVKFTFLWLGATEWEGRNCEVSVVAQEPRPREHDQLAAEVVPQEARQSTRSLPPSTWGR
jgi:glucoamylase